MDRKTIQCKREKENENENGKKIIYPFYSSLALTLYINIRVFSDEIVFLVWITLKFQSSFDHVHIL